MNYEKGNALFLIRDRRDHTDRALTTDQGWDLNWRK